MALLGQHDGLMTQPDPFLREGFGQSLKFFEAVMVLDKHRSSSWCGSDAQSILPNRHNPWNRSARIFRTWYYSVAVDDFNGDGKSDLVTADSASDTASVLLGNGDGTFQAKQFFGTGTWPWSVAVSDFNGDGKSDLVTANRLDDTASVLVGNGDGTFQAKQSFGSGSAPCDVAVGDFNGDGVKDLVTADRWGNTASVLLGNGTTVYGLQPITGVSLATQADALSAQGQIDDYLDSVNKVSGTIGTALSRFQIAAQTASSVADVSTAAEARITDADVADNSAALVRNQILQQAASAILAQANQQPALAVTLLRE